MEDSDSDLLDDMDSGDSEDFVPSPSKKGSKAKKAPPKKPSKASSEKKTSKSSGAKAGRKTAAAREEDDLREALKLSLSHASPSTSKEIVPPPASSSKVLRSEIAAPLKESNGKPDKMAEPSNTDSQNSHIYSPTTSQDATSDSEKRSGPAVKKARRVVESSDSEEDDKPPPKPTPTALPPPMKAVPEGQPRAWMAWKAPSFVSEPRKSGAETVTASPAARRNPLSRSALRGVKPLHPNARPPTD